HVHRLSLKHPAGIKAAPEHPACASTRDAVPLGANVAPASPASSVSPTRQRPASSVGAHRCAPGPPTPPPPPPPPRPPNPPPPTPAARHPFPSAEGKGPGDEDPHPRSNLPLL